MASRSLSVWTFVLLLWSALAAVVVAFDPDHSHNHNRLHSSLFDRQPLHKRNVSSTPEELVAQALQSLALRNKARLENPKFNKLEIAQLSGDPKLAPPLEYQGSNDTLTKRQSNNSTGLASDNSAYTIPAELAEAARIVAESTPQVPTGDHGDVAAQIRQKYTSNNNDTNIPASRGAPEGRLSAWAPEFLGNSSQAQKRDSSYWMIDMPQLGSSPFGPNGYQIWRNVKDYGAVGDGATDDTAAINLAISDGGRCGPGCGSSTVSPAVVYFPPGTYLVSSSIIQYYNTQFLGDPTNVPTILAASSFVGGGVIVSDVYISDTEQWYINTNNFLRSIRNFKIDIRNADPYAYICGIHWQVAQGSSLENIEFYMRYNSETPGNTQQGIYMENGSGGFLADLIFVGGNFGAYFGNQQFTTSHLIFVNCETAVQVHWDWAWTMQDFIIEGCGTGLSIVGGANGVGAQTVGSLILIDSIIANTANGIATSLLMENSTSFLLQNVGFFNVQTAVKDVALPWVLMAGGNQVYVDNWGFGKVAGTSGDTNFVNGGTIPTMSRNPDLLGTAYDNMSPNLFTRRRPKYYDVPQSKIMNVKALGAVGDGVTDDTAVLNGILDGAANTSSIVYFPFGVYTITDTLRVPVGTRIIGQAWSQIMASGANFEDESRPRVAVKVGKRGDEGVVEIQDMMFTVSGPTAGAILVEWNVRQSSQGSTGMWDSHFRVGGAAGSNLQQEDCPAHSGAANPDCKAASLLMHLTPGTTPYLENVWMWAADHDLDKVTQDAVDVYAARGLLVQSDLAWLWGTSVEHCTLYQYQLSGAKNIVMGMIQAESPYFQPSPAAPLPFTPGLFPDDPSFSDCSSSGAGSCAISWHVRILDSSSIYILGSGLYSWFSGHSQACLSTSDCQQRGFDVQQSKDLWIYNLCTKAIVEMISPWGGVATLSSDNVRGYLSSILAWLQGSESVGERDFEGFHIYTMADLDEIIQPLSGTCKTALTQRIDCYSHVETFGRLRYYGSLNNSTLTSLVCDTRCGESLQAWFDGVESECGPTATLDDGSLLTLLGGRMLSAYHQTCLKDIDSGRNCNDLIDRFTVVTDITLMPTEEICSYCYIQRNAMMQNDRYSIYNDFYKRRLEYIYSRCEVTGDIDVQEPPIPPPQAEEYCLSDNKYITQDGDTCDSIALAHSVSSAALYMGNQPKFADCNNIVPGLELCIPLSCDLVYVVQANDTCFDIERNHRADGVKFDDITRFNPWVDPFCSNLISWSDNVYGHVICLSPQAGFANATVPGGSGGNSGEYTPKPPAGYSWESEPIPDGATLAPGTAVQCKLWYVAQEGDICPLLALLGPTTIDILLLVNPSLGTEYSQCNGNIVPGLTYCVLPTVGAGRYEYPEEPETSSGPATSTPTSSSTAEESSMGPSTTSSEPPTPTYPAPPGPTFSGNPANCNAWHLVQSGDSCWTITQEYSITYEQFYEWNPAVQNECQTNFWPGYAYCVGIDV